MALATSLWGKNSFFVQYKILLAVKQKNLNCNDIINFFLEKSIKN